MAEKKREHRSGMPLLGGMAERAAKALRRREIEQRELLDEAEGRLGVSRKKKEKARD